MLPIVAYAQGMDEPEQGNYCLQDGRPDYDGWVLDHSAWVAAQEENQ